MEVLPGNLQHLRQVCIGAGTIRVAQAFDRNGSTTASFVGLLIGREVVPFGGMFGGQAPDFGKGVLSFLSNSCRQPGSEVISRWGWVSGGISGTSSRVSGVVTQGGLPGVIVFPESRGLVVMEGHLIGEAVHMVRWGCVNNIEEPCVEYPGETESNGGVASIIIPSATIPRGPVRTRSRAGVSLVPSTPGKDGVIKIVL